MILQRKLLMCCPANYVLSDARERSSLGLYGGSAIANTIITAPTFQASAWDESNAFTSIMVPVWLSYWQCCPPVRAAVVWEQLSDELRNQITPSHFVCPRYLRLAMGSTHSVHILMTINIERVGRLLWAERRGLG